MEFIEIRWDSELYRLALDLRNRLLRAPLGLDFSPTDLEAEAQQLHFGIKQDERLLACLVVVPLSASRAKIRQMCVDTSDQRGGVGTRLMTEVEAELVARGFAEIELNARDHATGFYRRLGYEVRGERSSR